jgi:hypothetical protein
MRRASRTLSTLIGATASMTVALTFAATPALAASSNAPVYAPDGTRAGETWFNRATAGSHSGHPWFDLLDAKCDAHPVYVEYTLTNSQGTFPRRFDNTGGCGTTAGTNLTRPTPFTIKYHTCIDIPLSADLCSGWYTDHS